LPFFFCFGVFTTMFLTTILITCFVCLVAAWFFTLRSRYNYFRLRGIPGPPPLFFFGHFRTIWSVKSYQQLLHSWTKKFGPIYGLFEGTRPLYIVSDVNFLQEVFIKQFSSFHSHRTSFLLRMTTARPLITADIIRWRRQRRVINPAFSAVKLKMMTPLVNQCIGSFMKKLSEISNEKTNEFNIYLLYKRLTMDVICEFIKKYHCISVIDFFVCVRSLCIWDGYRYAE
jgi:hypothetical protein